MKKKTFIVIAVIVCVVLILTLVVFKESKSVQTIDEYVTNNISVLSPEIEVLGGTFYITNLETYEGKGMVEYEDGHNAYVADFSYRTDNAGDFLVEDFLIRK